jgi:hypothetical protein
LDRRHRSVVIALLATVAFMPGTALAQDDVSVSLAVQGVGEEVNNMTITVAGEMARFDIGEQTSMVWSPDWWRMIQHENRMYMEFDKAMLERMRQMMGNMRGIPGIEAETDDFDPANMTFERTGATDTVMEYEVFEVAFSDDEGHQGSMWLSEEAEISMFEIMPKLLDRLGSIAGPMMRGRNPAGNMQRYMQYARAQGLPDGKVLRMTTEDGANFEVTGWVWGPFGADFWEAPDGYQKQTMPAFPR